MSTFFILQGRKILCSHVGAEIRNVVNIFVHVFRVHMYTWRPPNVVYQDPQLLPSELHCGFAEVMIPRGSSYPITKCSRSAKVETFFGGTWLLWGNVDSRTTLRAWWSLLQTLPANFLSFSPSLKLRLTLSLINLPALSVFLPIFSHTDIFGNKILTRLSYLDIYSQWTQ